MRRISSELILEAAFWNHVLNGRFDRGDAGVDVGVRNLVRIVELQEQVW